MKGAALRAEMRAALSGMTDASIDLLLQHGVDRADIGLGMVGSALIRVEGDYYSPDPDGRPAFLTPIRVHDVVTPESPVPDSAVRVGSLGRYRRLASAAPRPLGPAHRRSRVARRNRTAVHVAAAVAGPALGARLVPSELHRPSAGTYHAPADLFRLLSWCIGGIVARGRPARCGTASEALWRGRCPLRASPWPQERLAMPRNGHAFDDVTPQRVVEACQPKRRFQPVRFKDIALNTTRAYLVKELIPREGLVVVWGPPKCGKSFFTFDLMLHVALGWRYRGRRVDPGPVVYVACEGERGFGARAEAFREAKLAEGAVDPPFYLLATRLDLVSDSEILALDIKAAMGDGGCAAIVIDTLNRSLAGSESSDEDMSAYVRAADALRERFQCAVIVVHHCWRR